MKIHTKKKSAKSRIVIALIVVLVLLGGWIAYTYFSKVWPFATGTPAPSSTNSPSSINYDPPTKEEIDESQDAKKRGESSPDGSDEQSSQPNPTPSTPKKTANIGISYADIYRNNLEIRAFTNSVIEGTGTCTATVTMKGMESMRVTRTSKAFIDTSSTLCEAIYIPVSELHAGKWTVVVKFSSPDHEGTSDAVEVTIP